MQDAHYPARDNDSILLSQPSEDSFTNTAKSDDALTHQLVTWLGLPIVREQRRYLEDHLDLLSSRCEFMLRGLLAQETEGPKKAQRIRDALSLLDIARIRGRTREAIQEAYINAYGGFILDLPPWLEEVKRQLDDLDKPVHSQEITAACIDLLQAAITHAKADSAVAPEMYAALHCTLAKALFNDDRTQMLEAAITSSKAALQVYTLVRYPRQYASVQDMLGMVYEARVQGEQQENREQAIACLQEALHVRGADTSSYEYAETQSDLGQAYIYRIFGKRRENLEQAIACLQEALRVFTLEDFPEDYAKAQFRLGDAYGERVEGGWRENLEQAIVCLREALHVYTLDAFPIEYVEIQNALGVTYYFRIAGERRENLEQAIACYRETLSIRTLDAFPYRYALTQNNLGIAYLARIAGERRENIERAIDYLREALRVHTLGALPYEDYIRFLSNLAEAYQKRLVGNRRENLEQAIAWYHEISRVFTLENFPQQYAVTRNCLGEVYQKRLSGIRRENLEQAIAYFQEALQVRTLDALPYEYAETQNNLGKVYQNRIAGEQRENLEQASACFRKALRFYIQDAFPIEYRNAQLNLAETEAQLDNWDAVQNAYIAALEAEDLLVILGAGTFGRDAILKEGRDATLRLGYALYRLERWAEAAVAIERGRARGLAEAMMLDASDPALITDKVRRARYMSTREALIIAQADLHALSLQDLDEDTRRRLDLAYTASYRQARTNFDAHVSEIRSAHDPDDFLNAPLDTSIILRAAARGGPGHALVYLAATPWGGFALAALSTPSGGSSSTHFTTLDLPELTESFMNELIEIRLQDGSERIIGGFALAQMGEGFEQLLQQWEGETLRARIKALQVACRKAHQESTLERAAKEALTRRPFTRLAKQPLTLLNRADRNLLSATLDQLFLQRELERCLDRLGKEVVQPLFAWLHEQGATSLTLIPCGYLAAFPLTAPVLPDGRLVGEMLPISVAPSARSLLHTADSRSSRTGVYALGDPQHNLPWSEAEALTLAALAHHYALPGEAHVKYRATRDRLLTALCSRFIVDASCHGNFDLRNFLRSALHLAKGDRITMSEILSHQADLRGLRLLILSACQTALLDLQGARDEVHSLAAAMLQAGAQAVLAAQWAVDDKATYLLIVRFAQEWLPHIEQESPAAALARAQSWLRSVTNAELAAWHSTMPVPSRMKQLTRTTSSASLPGQAATRKTVTRWQRILVRGQHARYMEDEAELAIRIGAEENMPSARPYADPYYWAGFQVIGW